MNAFYQRECTILSLLMGLNDTFSQIRGQILLLGRLPPINKVFALLSQEDNQRRIGSCTSLKHRLIACQKSPKLKGALI